MPILAGNPRQPWRERNPGHETPTRWRERPRVHVQIPGRSPGTMEYDEESGELAAGQIRRLWRQAISFVSAPPPVDVSREPAIFTRALRYKASSFYLPSGSQNSRLSMLHTVVTMATRQPRPTLSAGTRRARPTIRNRMASFGSRVEPLNRRAMAAQEAKT